MSEKAEILVLMTQLETMIDNLITVLNSDDSLLFVGYEAHPVKTMEEKHALDNGQENINVTTLNCWNDRYTVLNYFKRFYVRDGDSTRFVSRMPGLIQTQLPAATIIALITQINHKKNEIKTLVRKNRNSQQRHAFIHEVFPQIMTEQVYRHIRYTQEEIKSVWFRWKTKLQTNRTYSNQAAIQFLEAQKEKPKGLFLANEWAAHIEAVIHKIESGQFKYIQRQHDYRTFPDCHYSFYDYQQENQQKSYRKNRFSATTPWILLNQPHHVLPKGTPLSTYKVPQRKIKSDKQIDWLFAPLKIIGVTH